MIHSGKRGRLCSSSSTHSGLDSFPVKVQCEKSYVVPEVGKPEGEVRIPRPPSPGEGHVAEIGPRAGRRSKGSVQTRRTPRSRGFFVYSHVLPEQLGRAWDLTGMGEERWAGTRPFGRCSLFG